ncbi:MAG: AIR synthase-related protein [Planctomycetota bacterium]
MSTPTPPTATPSSTVAVVHRFEVRRRPGFADPKAEAITRLATSQGLSCAVGIARVYLVEAALSGEACSRVANVLLADPVTEVAIKGVGSESGAGVAAVIEVHPLPGVMDPAAQSVREAIRDLTGVDAEVSTGWRYDMAGASPGDAEAFARRSLCNPVVHAVHTKAYVPAELPKGHEQAFEARSIAIRELDDDQLQTMSRSAHLFLSLEEMRAVRDEYRRLGREPRDIELETLAQTWSEHCVHKTLKSKIRYKSLGTGHLAPGEGEDRIQWEGRPGHTVNADGSVTIDNLLKSTVAAATFELIDEGCDWTLSVFKDNSGVIALDDQWGVCIKVETHNHPSAIEPYGGSATGIGGCIRDVIGTGLGAKPIASTDVFCVAYPSHFTTEGTEGTERKAEERGLNRSDPSSVPSVSSAVNLPPGCLPPRRVLTDVVAGIRDYGNRMGIPTVSGGVYFDDRHVGNPLVFAGCIGLIPRSMVKGEAKPGDRIIALGGRTGRDGIHGATFSSAEMEHTHVDEFAHAVQIGNAIEEKRVLDAILRARGAGAQGRPLYSGMTDCGAGGFSSAVGEMGGKIGAEVNLDRAPLKYAGLTYTEIWISEAQERMVLAVPPENLSALRQICDEEGVEMADLGRFGTPGAELILKYRGAEVGRMSMSFLHDGIPTPTREATWGGGSGEVATWQSGRVTERADSSTSPLGHSVTSSLLALLSHPNIASKHWIIRQYDHEVQGNVVARALVGPTGRGPGDASVLEPVPGSGRGIAISQGLQTSVGDPLLGGDPYEMVLSAVDEVVRNLVCVGADPARIAILDNFCWPSCTEARNLGSLVRAAEGCYDAAKAYRTPFVSGKDSLNNQLRYTDPTSGQARVIEIPPTLLITGLGIVPNITRTVTMDAKAPGNVLVLVGARTTPELGASHYVQVGGQAECRDIPRTDVRLGATAAKAVATMIRDGYIASAHDCSEGGVLVAIAEMLIASGGPAPAGATSLDMLMKRMAVKPALGFDMEPGAINLEAGEFAFAENSSRYVLEVRRDDLARVRMVLSDHASSCGGLWHTVLGTVSNTGRLRWAQADLDESVEDLARAWLAPLDW